MTLENILANFQLLDDWEDRYRYQFGLWTPNRVEFEPNVIIE